ncbi:MAG: hypothetical protein ABSB19_20660 [Methylomonas sp.]
MEPEPGKWREGFPVEFLQRLKYYRDHDIGVIFLLGYGNGKAYPNDNQNPTNSTDPTRFADYAVHVTELMKFAQVRFALEILNEPHNNRTLRNLGGNWQGKAPSPWVDYYVRIARETVSAVHAIDPDIKLLTDDDMWIVHYWFLEAGLPPDITGFAIHPYTGPKDPEHTAVSYNTDWTQPFSVVDKDGSFGSAVRRLREHGIAKLGKTPEIWITEWGWPVGNGKGEISDATLTWYLPRAFILAAAAGVKTTCWFSSHDAVDGPMGLTRNDNSKRDSFFAYRTLAAQLADLRLTQHVFGSDHPAEGVQGFLFENGQQKKLVVWNVSGQDKTMIFPDAENSANGVDVLGREVELIGKTDNKKQIKITGMPVYFSGKMLENISKIEFSDVLE